jgi:hypothetical protein
MTPQLVTQTHPPPALPHRQAAWRKRIRFPSGMPRVLLRPEDIQLVREALDGLLKVLIFRLSTFEGARGFLCGVKSWVRTQIDKDAKAPTLRFSSSYVSIVTLRPATSSSLANNASLNLSASAARSSAPKSMPIKHYVPFASCNIRCCIPWLSLAVLNCCCRCCISNSSYLKERISAYRTTPSHFLPIRPITTFTSARTVQICVPNCASRVLLSFSSLRFPANSARAPSSDSCRSASCASVSALPGYLHVSEMNFVEGREEMRTR